MTRMVRLALCACFAVACNKSDRVLSLPVQTASAPTSQRELSRDISAPLRDLVATARPGSMPVDEEDSDSSGKSFPAPRMDALLLQRPRATALTANPFTLLQTFAGISTSELTAASLGVYGFAADSSGAVGPNHYVHSANFAYKVFDKSGNVLLGPAATSTFWSGFSGAACGGDWSDVVILYDRAADRWFVSRFAQDSASKWYECFAISTSADPTGSYYRYAWLIDDTEFNDYPKFGIWPDGYYMTSQRDKIFAAKGEFVDVFERSQMLLGASAQHLHFVLNNGGVRAGMLPADWDGQTAPPAGAPNPMIRPTSTALGWASDSLQIWEAHTDWGTPGNSTLTNVTNLSPAAYTPACGTNQNCVPQPGTATGLDPLSYGFLMYRLAYRNFGDHQAMVVNHTVDAGDGESGVHVAVRWYELRKTGGAWSIFQQGTHAPDAEHRWIGSMAQDRAGNIALGYNISGTVFPGIRFAGRTPGDAAGTMSQETTIKSGGGSLTLTGNNFVGWSDYSQVTLDPVDDCTFWYVNSYQPSNSTNTQNWATHVGSFRADSCPKATTSITYTGDTTEDFHDQATLSATLTNTFANLPVQGATLHFHMDTHACDGVTDAAGHASCHVTPDEPAGNYALTVEYAGDAQLAASDFAGSFTVTKEETTLVYTGQTVIANGGSAAMSGVLKEDGTVPIAGRTVTFTLGGQSCNGVTNAAGVAACSISPVSQPLGPETIQANFAGDAFYLPSSDSAQAIVFAFLDSGAFVLGDQSATGAVTYWSAEWSIANSLSGGAAPDAFKGFAAALSAEPPACGAAWTTRPGNSSGPPATVPSYMGVFVASSVGKSGMPISGDAPSIVVVKTDAGYGPAPGHVGTGTVVAKFCP